MSDFISLPISLKEGAFLTFSFVIPCISITSFGISICGLTKKVDTVFF